MIINYHTLILKKNEIIEELKSVKNNDLEDLMYIFQLTYDQIIDLLDFKYNPTKRTRYSLSPGIYEVFDLNKTLKYILSDIVKVSITIDVNRIKSNIKFIQTLIFTEKSILILYWDLLDHILILWMI